MTVRALVHAVRRQGGDIALSRDGLSLIGRNIPKALHHHLRNRTNRDRVLHWLRSANMAKGNPADESWPKIAALAAEAEVEVRRLVTSPWTGGLISTDEYLETYATGDRRPS